MTDFAGKTTEAQESDQSFSRLLEETNSNEKDIVGKVISGTIVRVEEENVFINIGLRSEGIVPLKEFTDEDGNYEVKEGEKVEILIKSTGRGLPKISKSEADIIRHIKNLNEKFKSGEPVKVKASKKIKGGVECTIEGGIKAFLPSSQVQIGNGHHQNTDKIIGQSFDALIIEMDYKNVVISRRKLLETERETKRAEFVKQIDVGMEVAGVVSNIIGTGVFVDLTDGSGTVEGFMPIREVSWKRIKSPSDVLDRGQKITVKVISIENLGERIGLSYKQTQETPWEEFARKTPQNSRIKGKIVNVNKVGVFIEVAEGVIGLLHPDNIDWLGIKDPVEVYGDSNKGKEIEVIMLRCDPAKKKMSLGVKQLGKDPWKAVVKKIKKGQTIMTGNVKKEDKSGFVLEFEDGVEGFIRFSDLADSETGAETGHNKAGLKINGVVKNVDNEARRIILSEVMLNRKNERETLKEFNSKYAQEESPKLGDLMSGKIGVENKG